MFEQLRPYRGYIMMFTLNLALLVGVIYLLRRPEPRIISVTTPPPRATATAALIKVQVRGAVNQPGLYELPEASRIADALEKAGGAKPEADLTSINLARKLEDGEDVIIPIRAVAIASTTPTPFALSKPAATQVVATVAQKININTATVDQLMALPRIGQTLAQRIVDYRTQNGPFAKIDDLKKVRGISDALFDEIKDLITIQ